MKGRLKNIIVIIIALAIAIVTGFYLVPKDVEKTRQTTAIVRLKENIGKNQKIKAAYLETIEIGSYNLPEYIVKEPNEIINKYATVSMHKGEFAIEKYFQDEQVPDDAFLYEDVLVDGISFQTDLAKCVGGIPEKGDRIRAIIYKQSKDSNSESLVLTYDELANLEVIKVANKNGISIDEAKNSDESINNSIVPGVITVKANVKQQQLLVKGIYDGEIHLALRPRILNKEVVSQADNNDFKQAAPMAKDNDKENTNVKKVEKENETSKVQNNEDEEGGFKIDD